MKFLYPFALLFLSCASIQSLEGGPKDSNGPSISRIVPAYGEKHVTDPVIVIDFDEYIKSDKLDEVIIISPNQIVKPTIKIKNKRLTIRLNDSLLLDKTYTIQLNNGIVDVNEGNPVGNIQHVFSTGDYVDSFSYKGVVFSNLNQNVLKNYNVHLYENQNDSCILNVKPNYLIKTNKNGEFQFDNLPNQKFMVLVLNDENKNLLYDYNEESSVLSYIESNKTKGDTFYTFLSKKEKYIPSLIKPRFPGVVNFKMNQPLYIDTVDVIINDTKTKYFINNTRDTITAYCDSMIESIKIYIGADSFDFNYNIDSSSYKMIPRLTYTLLYNKIKIKSTIPGKFDSEFLNIHVDDKDVNFQLSKLNPQEIEIDLEANDKIQLNIKEGFITTYFHQTNKLDTIIINKKHDYKNQLIINLKTTKTEKYIIELIREKQIIECRYLSDINKQVFKNIEPGLYDIRIIKDLNKNKIWDPGSIFLKVHSEPVKIYTNINIRENWINNLDINQL